MPSGLGRWGAPGVQTYNPAQPEQLPTRLEAGTLNGHGIAGLSAALDYIRTVGMETIREKEEALMRRFYEGVSAIPGVTVYGDFTAPRTAVVALNIRDYDSGEVSDALAQDYGIATVPAPTAPPGCTGRWARSIREPCGSASAGSTRNMRSTRRSGR